MSYTLNNEIIQVGETSTNNSTVTPLGIGGAYTGTSEMNDFNSVMVVVKADQDGIVYMDFSVDGTNWDSTIPVPYNKDYINAPLIREKGPRYFRVRFENTSGVAQTELRLTTYYGSFGTLKTGHQSRVGPYFDTALTRSSDFGFDVAEGLYDYIGPLNKFGANPSVTTTVSPVTTTGFYRTPTGATSLEFVSSSANDTAAGSGARSITVQGLDANFNFLSVDISTSGTTASPLPSDFIRVFRWLVKESGTYANQLASSHDGTLTLREAGAGQTWSQIDIVDGLGKGQSSIASYTVPAGKTLYVNHISVTVETTKQINVYMFQRQNADDLAAPYDTMRLVREFAGLAEPFFVTLNVPIAFPEKTDVGFFAETNTGTAAASVEFDGIIVDNV